MKFESMTSSARAAAAAIPSAARAGAEAPTAPTRIASLRARDGVNIVNGDCSVTEHVFARESAPSRIGVDAIRHDAKHRSRILVPVRRI